MGGSGREGGRWRGGETTDKDSVNFINGLVRVQRCPINSGSKFPHVTFHLSHVTFTLSGQTAERSETGRQLKVRGRGKNT